MDHRSSPSPRPRTARGIQIARLLALARFALATPGALAAATLATVVLATVALAAAPTALGAAPAAPFSAGTAATAGDTGAAGAAGAASGAICDSSTALTVIGMDTDAGSVLIAVAGAGGGAGSWIVALDSAGAPVGGPVPGGAASAGAVREAHAYPEQPGGRFGGSVGPGPVLALQPCGANCLQPVRFDHGRWQPLGDPVNLPSASTVAATYDASGAPWLVAHTAANQEGQVQALAFRYEASSWKSRGGLAVTAIGQPQVVPAPQRHDGVVSGTGLFSASGPPSTWVQGLPGVTPARRGQLLAVTSTDAAYLSADGVAYLSADAGKTWRRSTWTPWGGGDTTGMWRQGTDYGIDLPFGDRRGALQLVWFDRRSAAAERVVLTRLGAGGAWTELAAAPVDVTSRNGEHLPVTQVLVPRPDTWILLSGCAATATGSGLVFRTFEQGQLSEPRFVPIVRESKSPSGR
jgi:hypothetical protein